MKRIRVIRRASVLLLLTLMLPMLHVVAFAGGCISPDGVKHDDVKHDWGSWKIKQATCASYGAKTRKCKRCGEKQRRQIPRTSHSWSEWTTIQEESADHRRPEIKERSCSVCGKKDQYFGGTAFARGQNNDLDEVVLLQLLLSDAGYDCGKADGIFGAATERAVRAYQEDHDLLVTGVAYPEMIDTMLDRYISQLTDEDILAGYTSSNDTFVLDNGTVLGLRYMDDYVFVRNSRWKHETVTELVGLVFYSEAAGDLTLVHDFPSARRVTATEEDCEMYKQSQKDAYACVYCQHEVNGRMYRFVLGSYDQARSSVKGR